MSENTEIMANSNAAAIDDHPVDVPLTDEYGSSAIDEVAWHIAEGLEAKALLNDANEILGDCAELQQRLVDRLHLAGTKVTEALHEARQQAAPTIGAIAGGLVADQVERVTGYADRLIAGREQPERDRNIPS